MDPDQQPVEHRFFATGGPAPWEAASKMDSVVRLAMERWSVPGVSLAVGEGGMLVWAAAYGYRDSAAKDPLHVDSQLQAASVSKAIAAAAALSLVAEGRLDLDAPVAEYLDSWPLSSAPEEGITLRRLLSHTSGLGLPGFKGYRRGESLPDRGAILRGAAPANHEPVRLESGPGLAYRYSGGAFVLVEQIIADSTGASFTDQVESRVFEPAGMENSSFEAVPDGASLGHRRDGTKVDGDLRIHPESAAAGLWTTAADLVRFAMAIDPGPGSERSISLPRDPGDAMWAPEVEVPGQVPRAMGMGLFIRVGSRPRYFHSGSNTGFRALLIGVAGESKAAAVLTNGEAGEELAWEIVEAIAEVFEWPD